MIWKNVVDYTQFNSRHRFIPSFLILIGTGFSGPAYSSWQETRWEMSIDDVKSLYPTVSDTTDEEKSGKTGKGSTVKPLIKMPYTSGEYQFTAYFGFDERTGGLANVQLELENRTYHMQLLGSLRTKYGVPASEKSGRFHTFSVWYNDGDKIMYSAVGDTLVTVDYAPRDNMETKGL